MNEILYVNKPKGITSFDLCFKLRKVLNTKRIGHCGTLDPNATGVMIVLSGNTTKANQFLVSASKEYVAKVKLGIETDTLDITGNIIKEDYSYMLNKNALISVLNGFIGDSVQEPPITSAIKINGKKLYEYQRENKEVEIPLRNIIISEMELLEYDKDSFTFRCACSSGTYIRSLVRDILKRMNLIGTLEELTRTKIDDIDINQCDSLEDVLSGNYHSHSLYDVLKSRYPIYQVDNVDDVLNGKKLHLDSSEDEVLLVNKENVLAIYRKDGDIYRCVRGLF